MKLINSVGPNPRMVRMFMAEKGLDIPMQDIDLRGGENRQEAHLKRNPSGTSPSLELDNGDYLSEITVICEYLEEKQPSPPLIGTNAEERGEARMWTRRIDLNICEPMANGFRFGEGIKMFGSRMRCLPEASDGLKAIAQDNLAKLDGWIAGKQWICGDRFTVADILLFCWLDFFKNINQPINPDHKNIQAWYDRVAARPSAAATAG
ncbi:MAG: glutathione S-transferase family protein [Alphaproteobacteria bacterium]|nr:glutathione S-transferase family protein [Alphaproteobacteria bacterium]MCB9929779.1 glutathione S-transferase family protein [Alphaproteobacteria bacterium]